MPDEVGAAGTLPSNPNTSPRVVDNAAVLVIGAGFGGIASALRMRARGYNVTLIDRLESIGGRAQVFERGGFRHEAGGILTLQQMSHPKRVGAKPANLDMIRLEPAQFLFGRF